MNRDNPSPDEPGRSRRDADQGRDEKERRSGHEGEKPKPAKQPSGLTVRTTGLVLDTGDGRDEEEIDGIPTEREV
ncbi:MULTISPECIES: hypothetical protein [unclassified Streptomyces]|uniref:hypothetical protein n=1 Tax=unclassified Streptomyces TaxID=2593676 RepID=UPI00093AE26D|nr:hypothetical protein [Streptomyces sp. CB02058]OKI97640.1 hypothetical protein AMK10_02070 [Streptomyces sp. CB02058]